MYVTMRSLLLLPPPLLALALALELVEAMRTKARARKGEAAECLLVLGTTDGRRTRSANMNRTRRPLSTREGGSAAVAPVPLRVLLLVVLRLPFLLLLEGVRKGMGWAALRFDSIRPRRRKNLIDGQQPCLLDHV